MCNEHWKPRTSIPAWAIHPGRMRCLVRKAVYHGELNIEMGVIVRWRWARTHGSAGGRGRNGDLRATRRPHGANDGFIMRRGAIHLTVSFHQYLRLRPYGARRLSLHHFPGRADRWSCWSSPVGWQTLATKPATETPWSAA